MIIPKQKKMSSRLGGVLSLLAKTMAFVSMFNFAMITRIQYYSPEDDYIRTIFPHYYYFLLTVSAGVLCAMAIIYIFIMPSEFLFSNQQAVKDNRSPIYNLLTEVSTDIKKLQQEIETLKKQK